MLEAHPNHYDAIISADTLVYFGDLERVMRLPAQALRNGRGQLVVTLEQAPETPAGGFQLNGHGRYSHRQDYVEQVVETAGLQLIEVQAVVLRLEMANRLLGLLLVAGHQSGIARLRRGLIHMAEIRKSPATQQFRSIAVNTTLGEDVLLLQRLVGQESLGRLFEFQLDLLSLDANIELDSLLGTNATVRYQQPKGGTRYFNGFVSEFRYVGERGNYAAYEMVLRPWLWFLTRTADCRIFQSKRFLTS